MNTNKKETKKEKLTKASDPVMQHKDLIAQANKEIDAYPDDLSPDYKGKESDQFETKENQNSESYALDKFMSKLVGDAREQLKKTSGSDFIPLDFHISNQISTISYSLLEADSDITCDIDDNRIAKMIIPNTRARKVTAFVRISYEIVHLFDGLDPSKIVQTFSVIFSLPGSVAEFQVRLDPFDEIEIDSRMIDLQSPVDSVQEMIIRRGKDANNCFMKNI